MNSKRLLFSALLVGGLLHLPSYLAQAQAFALNRQGTPPLPSSTNPNRKAPLRDVLNGFKSKYGVDILFEDRLVADQEVLSSTVEAGASLEKNLGNVLKSRGLRFKKIKSGVYAILSEQKLKKTGPDETSRATVTVVDVVLKADVKSLDEVVVVGYGTVKKSDLTGSVASISASELKKTQLTSFDQGLQGRAPGVQVTQSTGQPGGGVSIRVRGGNSITAFRFSTTLAKRRA